VSGWRRPARQVRLPFAKLRASLLALFAHVLGAGLILYWHAGQPRPSIAKIEYFMHFVEKFGVRIVVPPAPGVVEFDEILLPTLDQSEPPEGDTVVRAVLPSRHEGSQERRGVGAFG
jgi:hypothetical protein